jgi:hypothetical protein
MKKITAVSMNLTISVIGYYTGIYLMLGAGLLCLAMVSVAKYK